MKRSSWLIWISTLVVIGGGYWYFWGSHSSSSTSMTRIAEVASGSIRTTVKSTGKISPIQTTNIAFAKQGTLTKLYKKVGDSVTKGDILAEIDASSAYMDIESARISLSNARNNYDKLWSSTTESDKLRAKNTLTESESQLTILESEYTNLLISEKNTINQAEANIPLLEAKLTLAKSELEYTEKNTVTDTTSNTLEKDIANAFLTLEEIERMIPTVIKEFKEYSMIEDASNPRYGDLSAKDPSIKTQTESTYTSVVVKITDFSRALNSLRSSNPRGYDDTLSVLTSGRTLLSELMTLSTLITSEYQNSIESNNLPSDYLETVKTAMRTRGSEISSKLSAVNTTLASLKSYGNEELEALADTNSISIKKQAVTSATNDLAKAKSALEELRKSQIIERKSKEEMITKQKNTIALNRASYNELIDGPISADRISAQNSISSAEISLATARLALEDFQIIAPFDGVVNDIPWIVGDTTMSTEGILLENKNAYEISLSLDQIDIVKIQKGMKATIILDAFPSETYTGKVSRISEVPTETSGVVSYEAIVELSIPRTDIYTKMSATVEIITTEKTNILVIPTTAIVTENGKSYVNKASNPTQIARPSSFSGRTRSFSSGMRNPRGIDPQTASGQELSGEIQSFSGTPRSGSGGRMRGTSSSSMTSVASSVSIPSEKIEITIGASSDGMTEVVSGLSLGDTLVITSVATSKSTSTTSTNSTRNAGFGGGPPGGF